MLALNWIPSAASFVYGTTTQLVGKLSHITGYNYTGSVTIEAIASKHALTKWRQGDLGGIFSQPAKAFANGNRTFYRTSGQIPVAGSSQDELVAAMSRIISDIEDALPKRAPWTAQVTGDLTVSTAAPIYSRFEDLARFRRGVAVFGVGLDFAIGAGFQLANDYGSPYLSPAQVGARAIVAGSGSALLGAGGGAIGLLCGPWAIVCVPVGAVAGGLIWSEWLQPIAFQVIPGLPPSDRMLAPLEN